MPVTPQDAILLVPGLFGFGRFGAEASPAIAYFRWVEDELKRVLGERAPQIRVHEPPPTGSLEARGTSLALAVERLLSESGRTGADRRVHVVGHSTGGLDARLLVNPRFVPGAGPSPADKARMIRRIGGVVAIAAPMLGAPFAAHAAPALPHLVGALYVLSIVTTARGCERLGLQHGVAWTTLLGSLGALTGSQSLVQSLFQPELREQVGRFLSLVASDTRLFHDLAPAVMEDLNASVAEADSRAVRTVVTVSPPPRWAISPFRQLYFGAYWASLPWPGERTPAQAEVFPTGEWIGSGPPDLGAIRASDGIVPSSYQVLPSPAGPRPKLICADHLDVVGHFDGVGETLLKSGAQMTRERFSALWAHVAACLDAADSGVRHVANAR